MSVNSEEYGIFRTAVVSLSLFQRVENWVSYFNDIPWSSSVKDWEVWSPPGRYPKGAPRLTTFQGLQDNIGQVLTGTINFCSLRNLTRAPLQLLSTRDISSAAEFS